MEDVLSSDWMSWLAAAAAVAIVLTLMVWVWRKTRARHDRSRRIAAARVRSGHVPLEIPTVPAALTDASSAGEPEEGASAVVDERPRLHLSYVDAQGKLTEGIVQVEQLDLMRNVIVARGDFGNVVRTVPLDRIRRARNAQSGRAFSLRTWVDAVRAARRRRELYGSGHADTSNEVGW